MNATRAVYWLAVAALAVALKRFYSDASAQELRFVLAPTTWLVGGALGQSFEFLPGAGYQSRELSILVSPACAGVNFLVIGFVTVALSLGAPANTAKQGLARLAASLGIAYGAAIVINALRIIVSVLVAHRAAHELGLSFQSVHRWIGIALYVPALLGIAALVSTWRSRQSAMLIALACYALITLVVPLLRGASRNPGWGEHALAILLVTGACAVVLAISRRRTKVAHLRALSSWAFGRPAGRT